jgi:hypothetical protein
VREQSDMYGRLTLQLTDRGGDVVARRVYRNRIVRTGRLLVAQMFGGAPDGATLPVISHIAVGTGGAPTDDDQAALISERSPRKPVEDPVYTDLVEGDVKRIRVGLTASFDFGEANGPEPLQEAGLFNAAADGVMYNRVVFEPVTKTDAFKLTLLWEVVF